MVLEEINRVLYWCPICQIVCSGIQVYQGHVRNHHPSDDMDVLGKLYPIHVKDAVTKTKLVYKNGARVTSFQCLSCSQVFTSSTAMSQHLRLSPEGRFTCVTVCPEGIGMNRTVAESIFCRARDPCLCTICGKSYTSLSALTYHLETTHSGSERKFACEQCSAAFMNLVNLKRHWKTHKAVRKKYICETCGKTYLCTTGLKMHAEKEHGTPKKFPCPVCHKLYFPKYKLNKHVKIHDVNRPTFSCNQCGQKFCSKFNLDVHERIHSGFKPYKCTICVAAFAQKSSLNVHMRKHGLEIQQRRQPIEREDIAPPSGESLQL